MKVYLDDERTEPRGWFRVKTAKEAIKVLKNNKVDVISLDHDLGEPENGTGYDVLVWMEMKVFGGDYNPPEILIHTANPSARRKMYQGVEAIKKRLNKRR